MKKMIMMLLLLSFCTVYTKYCSKDSTSPDNHSVIIEESDPITDIEGNIYKTVKIGDDVWMAENLNVSHFRNGDPIPEVKTKEEWERAATEHTAAWCYYNNNPENGNTYGKLYNWYAVDDSRGLEPEGWRVPGTREWTDLIGNLEGDKLAGKKMKSITGWNSEGNGDNSSKFAGYPGGGRVSNGDFTDIGSAGIWWSSSGQTAATAWGYNVIASANGVLRGSFNKATGLSIRSVYCPSCIDDTTSALSLSEKLQKALDASLESGIGVGISAAVIMPDGETWIGVSGVSHGTTAITPNMRFAAGSIGKIFTATTILQLADEGLLTLEDSLHEWLPSFPYIDSTITIRQLLNHTSGTNDFVDNPAFWEAIFSEPSRFWTPEEIIRAFNREAVFPKGTDWNYSTTGYNLLRMIIKKITGLELSTVYSNRFWIPLGLNNTFTSMGDPLPANIVHSWYDLDDDGTYDDFFSWSRTAFDSGIAGEVWITAEDLAKWARAIFQDKIVLSQASLDQMLTFHSPCTGEEFFGAGYGLGVVKFNPQIVNGLEAYGHSGNAPGFAAACIYLPDYGVCIGLLDNTEEGESIGSGMSNLLTVITDYLADIP